MKRRTTVAKTMRDYLADLEKAVRARRHRGPRSYVVLCNPASHPNAWLPTTLDLDTELLKPIYNVDPAEQGDALPVAVFPKRALAWAAAEQAAQHGDDPRGVRAFILAPAPTPAQGGAAK